MDFLAKAMHCKAKHAINLKLSPTILDAGEFFYCPISLNHGHLSPYQKMDNFQNTLFIILSIEWSSVSVLYHQGPTICPKQCYHARTMQPQQRDYLSLNMFSIKVFLAIWKHTIRFLQNHK